MVDNNPIQGDFEKVPKLAGPLFREYWQAIVERWWVAVITLVLALVYGFYHLSVIKPVYAARSVIMIEPQGAKVMRGLESVDQTDTKTLDVMNTMVETIHSRTMLRLVVENLNLQDNPDFLPPNPTGAPHSKEEATDYLLGCVSVNLRKFTRLVDIIVQHPNPKMAAILADAVAKGFIQFGLQERINTARNAAEFLTEEAGKYREKLRQSELALDKYRETNNASSLETDQNFVLEQLKGLHARLDAAKADRFSLEGDFAKAEQNADRPDELINIPSISRQQAIATLAQSLAQKETFFATLSQQYKSKHPKYIAASSEIEELRKQLNQKLTDALATLGTQCKSARENEERLSKMVDAQEAVSLELDRKSIDYSMLKREAEANRTLYDSMVARMKEIDVTGEIDSSPVKIVEAAVIPGLPLRFNKLQYLMSTAFVGLLLGIGLIVTLMRSSPYLTTVAHVDRFIGVPVFGIIPIWRQEDGPKELNFFNSENHAFMEAFRSLRTAMLLDKEKEPRTFLVTSAFIDEGKTFVCCNLAVAFAQMGTKTLLIDADLRKPSVSHRLFGKSETPGLAEFLEGRATFEEIIRPTGVDNFSVITGGEATHKPAELLRKNVLLPLIQTALKTYERVIIDTPPLLAVSDALILAGDVETVCLTIRSGKSHRRAVEQAVKALVSVGKKPSGIILNAIHERHSKYHYYAYGHNVIYGVSNQEPKDQPQ